jgi:ubiquinone biosynthesis monooxygenase Coq7
MLIDKIIVEVDRAIKTLTVKPVSMRPHPDAGLIDKDLTDKVRDQSLSLMRVNHTGEICAQALYQGQALTARDSSTRNTFDQSAFEEVEHLAWTEARIDELGGKTSILNPLFYFASLGMGIAAGLIGDKWNLGFLEETEHQVEQHLARHLKQISPLDLKSIAIIKQMKFDEHQHAAMAKNYGAAELPAPVKKLMRFGSAIMTKTTYYI